MLAKNHRPTYTAVGLLLAMMIIGGMIVEQGGAQAENRGGIPNHSPWNEISFETSEILILQGLGALVEQQYEKALTYSRQAVEYLSADPAQQAAVYVMMGKILGVLERKEEAEQFLRQALALKPDSVMGNYYLGKLLAERGEVGPAISFYQAAIQQNPAYLPAFMDLGSLYEREGNLEGAIAVYQQAWEHNRYSPQVVVRLARALAKSGKRDEARRVAETGLRLQPNSSELGTLIETLGD